MASLHQNASASSAIGFPNGAPAFPSTDALEASSFKVVVPSWRRLNPATTSTSDFTVDVSSYSPKTPFVTKVTLVDVDIPHVQQLVESAWSRVYYQQGVPITPECRSLELIADSVVTSVVLPLPLDRITSYQRMGMDVTRFFLVHRAPAPLPTMATIWNRLPANLGMRIIGIPGYPGGFLLTGNNAQAADGLLAFDVVSNELASALDAAADKVADFGMFLWCGRLSGPSALAAVLSKAATDAMVDSCLMDALYTACDGPVVKWSFQFQYACADDRFTLFAHVPGIVSTAAIGGALAEYMGFGVRVILNTDAETPRLLPTPAHSPRQHPSHAYAKLTNGSPRCGDELAAYVQRAFNTYTWRGFRFGIVFPGAAAPTIVNVPGGRMTLRQLATAITDITSPLLDVAATYTVTDTGDKSGLRFHHTGGFVFGLDFTIDADFSPALIGYERRVLAAALQHLPTRQAVHIPFPSGSLPPVSDVWATYNDETQELMLQSVPFAPFTAEVLGTSDTATNMFVVTGADGFKHGLQPGAQVVLADVHGNQMATVVTAVNDLTTFTVVANSAIEPAAGPVTVVPQERAPINLFLQPSHVREKGVYATLIGFQPITYEACAELTSPGTVDVRHDPYLLLCLSFQAEDSATQTGNVHYPFETHSQIIFAKILKSAIVFRAEYDRMFSFDFRGTGIHLGYIRVRVLNSDGSLFESHGQHISVCLKFDVRESTVALGGPQKVLALPM